MAIAPITGKLRKRLLTDLTVAMGLAFGAGYAYWYGIHLRSVQRKEQVYLKLEKEKQTAEA